MAGLFDLLQVNEGRHDQTSSGRERSHPNSPIIVTSSAIEVIAPISIVTPQNPKRCVSTPYGDDDPTMTPTLACSSTTTEGILDTVDDCVGWVNQISLQHDFEDSLLDVILDIQNDLNGLPVLPPDNETKNIAANEANSLFHNTKSTGDVEKEEYVHDGADIDVLNWCRGNFQG